MAKLDINRFAEMETFVKVVELGGFSATAKYYRKSPSAISKLITRLEARLNSRLLKRSTRGLQITEEGNIFYEQSIRVLSSLDEAEQSVLTRQIPKGHLRVTANIAFGQFLLLPLVAEFLQAYPEITLDINLTDKVMDLLSENTDVAIRTGPLKNSTLRARKLGETQMLLVAAPQYLKKKGIPKTPRDLKSHNLLRFNFSRLQKEWLFLQQGKKITIKPQGNIEISDGQSMRYLALSGVGIARLAAYQVKDDVKAGRLVRVLDNYNSGDNESIYVVFLGQGSFIPARIRAFLDFMVDHININFS